MGLSGTIVSTIAIWRGVRRLEENCVHQDRHTDINSGSIGENRYIVGGTVGAFETNFRRRLTSVDTSWAGSGLGDGHKEDNGSEDGKRAHFEDFDRFDAAR